MVRQRDVDLDDECVCRIDTTWSVDWCLERLRCKRCDVTRLTGMLTWSGMERTLGTGRRENSLVLNLEATKLWHARMDGNAKTEEGCAEDVWR